MATSAASSTAAARTPQRSAVAANGVIATSALPSGGSVKRARRTPSGVALAAAAASALLTPSTRRAPPKAKLNINFSASKASKASSSIAVRAVASARTPLRAVANGAPPKSPAKPPPETKPPVDVSKILRGVYAMVDVRLGKDAEIDCSDAVARKLVEMGATIMKKKSGRLTHVVVSHYTDQWKEKVTKWQSVLTPVEVVSQLWVNACFHNQQRMSEKAFFPVNKGGAVAAKTPAGTTAVRVARTSIKKEPATGAAGAMTTTAMRKRAASAKTSPARSVASELAAAATPSVVQAGDIVAGTPGTQASTPTPSSLRTTVTRKRRAQSMEPMASDAILKLLESSKKLQKQSADSDALTTRALLLDDTAALTMTPVKRTRRQTNQASTPPLTVRLRAAIERRKTISSASSISKELKDAHQEIVPVAVAEKLVAANTSAASPVAADCVAESCSEGENEETKPSGVAEVSTTPATTSINATPTPAPSTPPATLQLSAGTLSLNIESPVASAKGEWACSICSCINAKTRRLCKGCKASRVARVAAKTSVTAAVAAATKSPLVEKTPPKRPAPKTAATTPTRRRTPATTPPVPSSVQKAPPSAKKSPVLTKRPRYSSDLDTNGSVRSVNLLNSEKRGDTVTPATKRQRTTPPSAKTPSTGTKTPGTARTPGTASRKGGPPRAVIGITGVDSETRGVIECAVHGIDANAASEEGHRKARVVKSVDYAAGVTHLIVGRDTKRTLKVLFAIARGAWILSEGWVFTSLEQEKWLKEEDYELSMFPARHLRLEPEQRQVFRTLKFFVGSKIDPSREVLISLLQCAGGEVVNQIAGADYCICGDETLSRRAKRTKIKGVTPKWVFDSIANLRVEDHAKYEFASVEKKDAVE